MSSSSASSSASEDGAASSLAIVNVCLFVKEQSLDYKSADGSDSEVSKDESASGATNSDAIVSSEASSAPSPSYSSKTPGEGGDPEEVKVIEAEKAYWLKDPIGKKELWAWYAYDWAQSVYPSAAITGYIPLQINELAKKAADSSCVVTFGATSLRPATISTSFISFAVLFQFFAFMTFGALADYGNLRRILLGVTGLTGAVLTMVYVFLGNPSTWWVAGVLAILSNVFFGMSIIFYNAYLPILVRATPETWEFKGPPSKRELHENEERFNNKYSTRGYIWGYIGGVIQLLITVGIAFGVVEKNTHNYECALYQPKLKESAIWYNVTSNTTLQGEYFNTATPIAEYFPVPSSNQPLPTPEVYNVKENVYEELSDSILAYRINLLFTGVWWFAFMIPVVIYLKNRPGPALPKGQNYITASFIRIGRTLKEMRRFPNIFLMCVAYFIYADAYSTIAAIAILFASEVFNSNSITLGILLVEVPLIGIASVFVAEKIRRRWDISTKTMVYFHLAWMGIIAGYALLGFIPGIQFGLVHEFELYIIGAVYGINLGPLMTYSRSLFSMMVPKGREAVFFCIFELSDRGSSWIGPLVVGGLNQAFGSMRYGLAFIVLSVLLSFVILSRIDVAEGVEHVLTNGKKKRSKVPEA